MQIEELSKLEYFTAKALQGILANPNIIDNASTMCGFDVYISETLAAQAIKIANHTLQLLQDEQKEWQMQQIEKNKNLTP